VEDPIIRICKHSSRGPAGFLAILVSLFAIITPSHAKLSSDASDLNIYVKARLAETAVETAQANRLYIRLLKQQPSNNIVAEKAYRNAVLTGNIPLILQTSQTLRSNGLVDAEVPLFEYSERFGKRSGSTDPEDIIAELETLKTFAFMAPYLRAWSRLSTKQSPLQSITVKDLPRTSSFYWEEQKFLLDLASGSKRNVDGEIRDLAKDRSNRNAPLRMKIAQHFLGAGQVDNARKILAGKASGPETQLLQAIEDGNGEKYGRKLNARTGAAFFFQRVSTDLRTQQANFLGLIMAQNSIILDPRDDFSRLTLARSYAANNKNMAALESFGKIANDSPYFIRSTNESVAILLTAKDHESAETLVNKALRAYPDLPDLHILSGQSARAAGNIDAAIASFRQAIDLATKMKLPDRTLANLWLLLGGVQEEADRWPEGLQSLRKAYALYPKSSTILNYLGYAQLERRENVEKAVEYIREAHLLNRTSPAITDSLGWAYFLTGEYGKAVMLLEKALAGQPGDPTINEHLADAYWKVGRKFEARYFWRSASLFAEKSEQERIKKKIDIGFLPDLVSP